MTDVQQADMKNYALGMPGASTMPHHGLAVAETVLGWLGPAGPGEIAVQTAGWNAAAWEAARWAAQVHGIAPLLYQQLHARGAWLSLDPQLQHYLAEQYGLNTQRVELLVAELATIVQAARSADIALVPLKGAALAGQYYADLGLRPLADLDLLVRPADEARLGQLLLELGYERGASTRRHRTYSHGNALHVVSTVGEHPANPRGVELHAALHESFWCIGYDMTATAWAAASGAGDTGKRRLPADVLLEHLLIHAATDLIACKARLLRLYDLALVAPHVSEQGWRRLVAAASTEGEQRLLYAPLLLAQRYLGPIGPLWVLEALASGTPVRLRAYLAQCSLAQLSLCNPAPAALGDKLSWFKPGRERLQALRAMICPTPHELRERYPHLRGPLDLARIYVAHGRRAAAWPVRVALGMPRQAWLGRERGGAE